MIAANPIFARADEIAGMFAPAVVDIFAGCGGWSIGAEQAFTAAGFRDRRVDLMINHWTTAVAVHSINHPLTEHIRADVREVDPLDVLPGRRVAYLHASPDCTDHSKAKGGKPRRKEIRALADVVIAWAAKRRPDVITLENVEEFEQWGPLGSDDQPDKGKRGHEFKRWKGELEALGYVVEHRVLRACDYGAPTTRKRLFVVARCDGKPIIWPAATHFAKGSNDGLEERTKRCGKSASPSRVGSAGRGKRNRPHGAKLNPACTVFNRSGEASNSIGDSSREARDRRLELKPFITAADCIDWSIPMLSIFATPDEAKAFGRQHGCGTPRRPLKPKTLARIAGGLDKFVLKAAKPFIVNIENYGWNTGGVRAADEPLSTVTAGPKGGKHAAVDVTLAPVVARCAHGDDSAGGKRWGDSAHSVDGPLPTVTGSKDYAVASAVLAPYSVPRYGERPGQPPRCQSVDEPAATITGTGNGTNLVAAVLSRYNGQKGNESRCHTPAAPVTTLDTQNRIGLVAALVTKGRGDSKGRAADEPMFTVTSGAGAVRDAGAAHALSVTCAYLSHFYTSNSRGGEGDPQKPAKTVTGGGQHAAVTVAMLEADTPAPAADRRDYVAAFLAAYYGEGSGKIGHTPGEPMPTVVGRERFALVTVNIDGTTYVVTDIAMRMLTPRELANAQGFPDDYVIDRTVDGKAVSKADQVKLIGNAVPPAFARAIVKANVVDQGVLDEPPVPHRLARKAVQA